MVMQLRAGNSITCVAWQKDLQAPALVLANKANGSRWQAHVHLPAKLATKQQYQDVSRVRIRATGLTCKAIQKAKILPRSSL